MASMTSNVKLDLRFDISKLKYPGIYVHVASDGNLCGLWGHGSLHMTSEVTYDLNIELDGLNYLCYYNSLASISHYFKKFLESDCHPLTSAHARKNASPRAPHGSSRCFRVGIFPWSLDRPYNYIPLLFQIFRASRKSIFIQYLFSLVSLTNMKFFGIPEWT